MRQRRHLAPRDARVLVRHVGGGRAVAERVVVDGLARGAHPLAPARVLQERLLVLML